jgi:hypothetical protein
VERAKELLRQENTSSTDPASFTDELVASTFKANRGVNELTFAGGLRGEPLMLIDGETIPVPCIADAEIVWKERFFRKAIVIRPITLSSHI